MIMADIFYNKTITLYNLAVSDDVMENETWYPTVLENVRLIEKMGHNSSKNGNSEANTARLHIMLDDSLDKPFMKPREWARELNKDNYFTACQEHDFFVIGDTSIEDCETPDFFNYMKKNYDGVYRITDVGIFDLIPHLEIGGA
jgi:hypothetical protein